MKDVIKKSVVIGIIENKPKAIEACKTLMAAAVAKNIDATFFDVKVSQLLSKYYGESPKIMSALFEVAREEAPSVVFIDEFDSIALSRGADIDEESRRGLSTLFAELDGLSSKASDKKFVLVIAATNTSDAIDEAIMSRFGKKIEIPLPDYEACKEILRIHTERKGIGLEDDSLYDKLAGYCVEHEMSGRDIKFMCTEAIWNMIEEMNPGLEKLAEEPYERIREYELRTRELKERIFKAVRIKDGKEVAVKIPISLDPETGKAFTKEISNWNLLGHENIVELYDVNILPIPYLEMELCDSSLEEVPKPMEVEEAASIIFDLAKGLKHAHGKGIIHRD